MTQTHSEIDFYMPVQVDASPIQIKFPLSPSRMNLFFPCPRKFYYNELHLRKIEEKWKARARGIMVHKVIAEYFRLVRSDPSKMEIRNLIFEIFDEKWAFKQIYGEEDYIKQCLNNFSDMDASRVRVDGSDYLPTFVEQEFVTDEYHGFIDWYNKETGVIRDWKTSKSPYMNQDMQRQGAIYKTILEANNYPVNTVIFEMLYPGKSKILPIQEENYLENELTKITTAAGLGNFRKVPTGLCAYCPYQLRCEAEPISLWSEFDLEYYL
ncbi:MAG: PD-(D/E)XK nuclease family protein [Thermodesulfobacteriota bacterium]